ncbi:Uncharacterised protein [Scardovia inopinata]|uniref:Uncharacterized protein n=1 Tax=Scardovia inopinata F0304 TaxID=641146 RepID=W1MXG4_SCAIO|nr:hypothetical protein [Scardovia inopinata]EQW16357.1 hypothetical protein HMPREF9020_01533 [Scardovia inopinata F0304]SUV51037.1 Uncharacterised protein [Scardovia inopinata]
MDGRNRGRIHPWHLSNLPVDDYREEANNEHKNLKIWTSDKDEKGCRRSAETRVILGESTGADMDNKKHDLIVSFVYAIIGMGADRGYFWV